MAFRIRLAVAAAALGATLVVLPALAGGSKVRTRSLEGTIRLALIESREGKPLLYAGIERDKGAPASSVLSRATVEGSRVRGTTVNYFNNGTITSRNTHTIAPQSDGSLRFTDGRFTITGGTGRFKDATGGGTYSGRLPEGGTVIVLKQRFKIRY